MASTRRYYRIASHDVVQVNGLIYDLAYSQQVQGRQQRVCQGCVAQDNPSLCGQLPPDCLSKGFVWVLRR